MKTFLKWLLLLFGLPALSALAVGAWLINERVKEADKMPPHELWHTADIDDLTPQEYLHFKSFGDLEEREQQLFAEVYDELGIARGFSRYNLESLSSPAKYVSLEIAGDKKKNCKGLLCARLAIARSWNIPQCLGNCRQIGVVRGRRLWRAIGSRESQEKSLLHRWVLDRLCPGAAVHADSAQRG